ncbi:hypothetical protein ACFPBZ_29030, partial [Actinomycetospora atypica]
MTSSERPDTAPRHRREPVPRRGAHRVLFAFAGGAVAAVVVAGVATDLTRTSGDVPAATETVDSSGPGAALPRPGVPGAPVLPAAVVITPVAGAPSAGAPGAAAPGLGVPAAAAPPAGAPAGQGAAAGRAPG